MAREIVVWCDLCLAQDIRTAAIEHTVGLALGMVQPVASKTLAMCGPHTDEILKPLADALEEFGAEIEMDTAPRKRTSSGKSLPAQGGTTHERQERLRMMAEQTGTRKGRPPANGRPNQCLWCSLAYSTSASGFGRHLRVAHGYDGLREAFGGVCPICGKGQYEQMMSHVNKSHPEFGFVAIAEPFIWARDNGDPHGVYAAKLVQKPSLDPEEEFEKTRKKESEGEKARVGVSG